MTSDTWSILSEPLITANLRLTAPPLARLSSVTSTRTPSRLPSAVAIAAGLAGVAATGGAAGVAGGAAAVAGGADATACGAGAGCFEHPIAATSSDAQDGRSIDLIGPPIGWIRCLIGHAIRPRAERQACPTRGRAQRRCTTNG